MWLLDGRYHFVRLLLRKHACVFADDAEKAEVDLYQALAGVYALRGSAAVSYFQGREERREGVGCPRPGLLSV